MIHDKLKDKIEDIDYWQEEFANKTFMKALISVINLHKQTENNECNHCVDDGYWLAEYPCPTIEAIQKVLK